MIPQRLVMSAFGSYAGREEIDFSQAGPGIFLVTGDTGAGKTTIFDAITYALYDQTSGGRRDGRMMRSQYAAEDTPTFVEFSFQYKGQDYRIMRSPEYERASKRRGKDGERKRTLERSAVTLFLPDGTEYPGKKAETNRKIVEIIGLDAGQFTQTVMIAQGEFLKLLSARSDERKEIFSRIFQTDLYARMQQRLREEAGALGGQMKDMERQEDQEIARLFCPEEESLLGRLESAALPEERLEAVRLILQYGKSREEAAKRQIEELDKELEKVNRDLAVAQELNRRFDYLEEARKGRAALLENASAVEERQRRLERSREARLVCETFKKREEAGRQKALLEKEIRETAEKISQAGQQKKELVKNQEAALLEEQRCRKEYQVLTGQITQVTDQAARLAGSRAALQKWESQEEAAKDRKKSLEELRKRLPLLRKEETKRDICAQAFEKSRRDYQQAADAYLACNDAFLQAQAGILAKDLREGVACPVCGSFNHPAPAPLPDRAPDQAEVKAARKRRDEAEKEKDRRQQQLLEAGQRCAACLQGLLTEGKNVVGEAFSFEGEGPEPILDREETIRERELQECRRKKEEAREQVRQWEELEKKRQSLTEEQAVCYARQEEQQKKAALSGDRLRLLDQAVSQAEGEKKARQAQKEQAEAQEEALALEAQKALAVSSFETEYQCRDSLLAEEEKEELEKSQEAYRQKCIEADARVKTLEEQLEGKQPVETQGLTEQKAGLDERRQAAEQEQRRWYSKNENNKDVREHLKKIYEKNRKLKERCARLRLLDQTAGGSLPGRPKIDFESYVQRRYFQQIITFANRRLEAMTGGNFILRCRSMEQLGNRGSVGLDLDVYSLDTGKIRDVRTLSGGESFMAALAMALGMADVISRSAGGIQMKAMFVDEGFGSLDDYSREQAIGVLSELAGSDRMIGIISHVTELKESIDRQLVVTKTKKGSHVRWKH